MRQDAATKRPKETNANNCLSLKIAIGKQISSTTVDDCVADKQSQSRAFEKAKTWLKPVSATWLCLGTFNSSDQADARLELSWSLVPSMSAGAPTSSGCGSELPRKVHQPTTGILS